MGGVVVSTRAGDHALAQIVAQTLTDVAGIVLLGVLAISGKADAGTTVLAIFGILAGRRAGMPPTTTNTTAGGPTSPALGGGTGVAAGAGLMGAALALLVR